MHVKDLKAGDKIQVHAMGRTVTMTVISINKRWVDTDIGPIPIENLSMVTKVC